MSKEYSCIAMKFLVMLLIWTSIMGLIDIDKRYKGMAPVVDIMIGPSIYHAKGGD